MKCYYIDSVNGKTVFEPREAPVPQPKKGELLIKVRAASLNRGEILASISHHAVHEAMPTPVGEDVEMLSQYPPFDQPVANWRCFTDRANWLITTQKEKRFPRT